VVETARRREIEDVASTLFRERGYAGTSVRDIARAMDIQGASLYAHVASKQDVLRTIVERMALRFEHAADDALKAIEAADAEPSPTARLAGLTRAHVEVVTDDLGRATVFVHEWRSLEPDVQARMAKRRDAYERRFRAVIADGVDSGEFATVDPAAAAAFILTALNGLVAWYRPEGRLEPAAIADLYTDLAVRAAVGTDELGR
jgi:AcrR family transcriptional regulator